MKQIVLAVMLILSATVSRADILQYPSLVISGVHFIMTSLVPDQMTVKTSGVGKTQELAVKAALTAAVQKSVGVLIVSEQTVRNDDLVRNIVAQYSSGVVDEFEILQCVGQPVYCEIEAKVSPIKFMRKLEGDSQSVQFDGSAYYEKHLAIKNAMKQREKILGYYLSEMHRSGLDVKFRSLGIVPSIEDRATLEIKYNISWNRDFRRELLHVLHRMERDVGRRNGNYYYIQYGTTGLSDNRVYVPAHNNQVYNMIRYHVQRPVQVYMKELETCAEVPVNGIFNIGRRGEYVNQSVTIPPDRLKQLKSITIRVGC